MIKYIAFLRGINVSGQKIIKMEDLGRMFTSFGLKNVKTYIQSGNVIFESTAKNAATLVKKIEAGLAKELGYEVPVLLRTTDELEHLVERNPFKNVKQEDEKKRYVTFVSKPPENIPKLPFINEKKGVKLIDVDGTTICCLVLPLPNGTYGFPNAFIEKEYGVYATTRNWNTVCKILKV